MQPSLSEKEYPPQRLEDENQNSYYMNEYNRYEQESPTKPHKESCIGKCTRWTLYLLPFIFFLVCFALLIAVLAMRVSEKSGEVDSAIRALANFNENINAIPLYDIQIVASNETCPENYTKQLLYTWPGVYSGCLCTDGSAYTGSCFARTSCPDVSAVESIKTYAWQASLLCVRTYSEVEFIVPGNDCPENYWQAQSYLCLPDNETASPIAKLEVLSVETVPTSDSEDVYLVFLNGTANGTNSTVLHVTRSTTLSPLVDIEVQLSSPSCLDPSYTPTTSSGEYYPLLEIENFGCLYWGDSESYVEAAGNETQTEFDDDNDLTDVFSEIYNYDSYISSEDYYKLYGVKRISLGSSELCNSIDGTTLTEINESSEELLNDVAAGAILALILSTIGLLLSLCYMCCRGCRCGTKYYCQSRALPITLYVLGFIVAIILFCLAGYYYAKETEINSDVTTETYLSELISGDCFTVDGYMLAAQTLETFLEESITTVGPLIVFLLAWAIIFVVLFLFCWILRSCVKRLPLFIS